MRAKYVNPYTDFGFKKLFGEEASKDLLIDFLNSVLPQEHRVQTLTFRNPEVLPQTAFERRSVFDILCKTPSGETFIVEMQKAKQHYFKDRSLFYAAYPIREQAPKGDWSYELKAVYFIAILDFEYDEHEEERKVKREVMLKDQDGKVFYDKLRFIFLQMPLFQKTESELVTQEDKWKYFLKHLEDFDKIPEILNEPIFEHAFKAAELSQMSPKEHLHYEAELKVYRDNYSAFKTARDDAWDGGKAEGRAEGLAEGRAEGLAEGLAEGRAEGRAEGLAEGEIKGEIKAILRLRFGELPPELVALVSRIDDMEKLNAMADSAANCVTLDDFIL